MTIEYIEEQAGALGEISTFLNLGGLLRHWQARRSLKQLASLDDYMLEDLGLKRSDVEWAERVPLTRNPVLALEERVRRQRRSVGS
jgi:uncharacterized protein YjiS (DUF1127 family)